MRIITDKLTGSVRSAQNAGKMGRVSKSDRWFDGLIMENIFVMADPNGVPDPSPCKINDQLIYY